MTTPRRPQAAPPPARRRPTGRTRTPTPPLTPDVNLTEAQRLFVAEFQANGGNATRAYLASHPKCRSYQAAAQEGHKSLKKPEIRALLDKQRAARLKRHEMDADEVVALLAISARADIGEVYDDDGKMLPVHLWPDSIRLAVKAVKANGDVYLHDGLKARETIAIMTGRLKTSVNILHSFDHVAMLAGAEVPVE